ncbi:hypothetical protein [Planktothricoides raciborskii]|uniref:Uncharacterized protein n=1 Tax=Planktothricoides raciborskii GIHE-MW2 TaxID=2792601 RepID=A0AAU8JE24_9CYAN
MPQLTLISPKETRFLGLDQKTDRRQKQRSPHKKKRTIIIDGVWSSGVEAYR